MCFGNSNPEMYSIKGVLEVFFLSTPSFHSRSFLSFHMSIFVILITHWMLVEIDMVRVEFVFYSFIGTYY